MNRARPTGTDRKRNVAAGAVFVLLLVGFTAIVSNAQAAGRESLANRFATRASLTASFTRAYIDELAGRQRRQGERLLGGESVDKVAFEEVVRALEFDAAVLLDENGRLLQVWPAQPALIGRNMTTDYAHLRLATRGGEVGVSEVVKSATRQDSVTAIAVPFDTAQGRRVLSGAFAPSSTPLGSYLASANPMAGGNAFLIDSSGAVLATGHDDPIAVARLAEANVGVQELDTAAGPLTVAVSPVAGTQWRVVLTSPSAALYAPLDGAQWAPWVLLCTLALAGLLALVLFTRLVHARSVAATAATTDLLTGLSNRRAMDEHLNRAVAQARRHEQPLTALMIDLDHFKVINDTYGHAQGDLVLQATANHLREAIRVDDVAGRWGGEEFLVLLPHTDVAGGLLVAERIRLRIADAEPIDGKVTASIGLSVLRDGADVLLLEADDALYEAKADGRNRTNVAGALRSTPTRGPSTVSDRVGR